MKLYSQGPVETYMVADAGMANLGQSLYALLPYRYKEEDIVHCQQKCWETGPRASTKYKKEAID